MTEYKVKIKDYRQNTTHHLTQYAESQNEANAAALELAKKLLRHDELELADERNTKEPYISYHQPPKPFNQKAWEKKAKANNSAISQKYAPSKIRQETLNA